jgi:FxLD family lantipeptide
VSVDTDEVSTAREPGPQQRRDELGDFELDISFLEVGSTVKDLIYMTDDGCGTTCQSACPATCG